MMILICNTIEFLQEHSNLFGLVVLSLLFLGPGLFAGAAIMLFESVVKRIDRRQRYIALVLMAISGSAVYGLVRLLRLFNSAQYRLVCL
jgi:hypothetical protein